MRANKEKYEISEGRENAGDNDIHPIQLYVKEGAAKGMISEF